VRWEDDAITHDHLRMRDDIIGHDDVVARDDGNFVDDENACNVAYRTTSEFSVLQREHFSNIVAMILGSIQHEVEWSKWRCSV
jgi:hypothetical protein